MNPSIHRWSFSLPALTLALALLTVGSASAHPRTVRVPAGSVNALAAAIAKAGPGGTVLLKSGLHTESGPVTVCFPVDILGEHGSILQTITTPDPDFPITIQAALHLKGARWATVKGITFRPPTGTTGSCAIVLEDSPWAQVLCNSITDYQFGVLVHYADHARIGGNTIRVSDAWSLDPSDPGFLIDSEGIVVINGQHVRVTHNEVSGGFDGIWMCDEKGICSENLTTGNYIGLLLCRVAEGTFTISGADAFAVQPGTAWRVHDNTSHDNDWGIQVTDGAHDNVLANNHSFANHDYDCELTGDTLRYGYFVPGCFDNVVRQRNSPSLIVKDCGRNNTLRGDIIEVDISADPCF